MVEMGKSRGFFLAPGCLALAGFAPDRSCSPRMSERRAGEGSDRAADGFVRKVG